MARDDFADRLRSALEGGFENGTGQAAAADTNPTTPLAQLRQLASNATSEQVRVQALRVLLEREDEQRERRREEREEDRTYTFYAELEQMPIEELDAYLGALEVPLASEVDELVEERLAERRRELEREFADRVERRAEELVRLRSRDY